MVLKKENAELQRKVNSNKSSSAVQEEDQMKKLFELIDKKSYHSDNSELEIDMSPSRSPFRLRPRAEEEKLPSESGSALENFRAI